MLLHASCVAIGGKAILLAGPPGAGKSDLALRLIDGGAQLVADDQVLLICDGDGLIAEAPTAIAGLIEARHVGLMKMDYAARAVVALYIDLTDSGAAPERLPDEDFAFFLDRPVRRLRLPAFAASTPAKIRAFLTYGRFDD